MTTDNFALALRAFARRQPFRPFAIEFVTGAKLVIRHPELVFMRHELFVYMDPAYHYRIFDSSSVCQLLDPPTD